MMFFSKTVTLISRLIVVPVAAFSLCAEGDWDWFQESSSFAPEAYVKDASYHELFYSANMFYGDVGYDEAHSNRFGASIIADWKGYLGNKISEKDLNYFILKDSSFNDIKAISKAITTNKADSKWAKKYDVKDDKVRKFFTFTNLAKSLEMYTNNKDSWNYETQSYDNKNYMSVEQAKKVESIYAVAKDPFMKSRYWFLTMKSYFYCKDRNQAIYFFNKTQAGQERNELYYRALSYVAGTMYKNKDYAKSNFMYSLVFEHCPSLRVVAAYCFHPQEDKDFQESLNMAKTNAQKAALWALYGYYADEVQAIEKIYALDPKSRHLDYLLTRAINIEENKINSTEWDFDYGQKTTVKSEDMNPKLFAVVTSIAKAKNTATPYMWDIVSGYLETIKGNYPSAENYFAQAAQNIPDTKLAKEQLKLFQVFNTVASVKAMNAETEKLLLPELQWLFKAAKERDEYSKLRVSFVSRWTLNYLSVLYKKQGDEVMAELFFREKDFYRNPERLKKMENYFLKGQFSDWDALAQSLYSLTLDDIYEYKAIVLAYQNKIPQAIEQMEKSKKHKDTELLGNPFNGNVKDCNDCDHAVYQKVKYTKLSFLKKMQEMQNGLAAKTDKYNNALLLGNAFYSMSFYGNARVFYYNNIINQYGNEIEDSYDDMIYSNDLAKSYYQMAFGAATDDEQKAKAVFLLTKIERNDFYLGKDYEPWKVDYIVFEGYQKLMKDYSNTRYYQEVINECGYFKTVAGR